MAAGKFKTTGKQQYGQKGSEERLVNDRILRLNHYGSFSVGSPKTFRLVISETKIIVIIITLSFGDWLGKLALIAFLVV